MKRFVFVLICFLAQAIWADPTQKGVSGIPAIDTLNDWEWDIHTDRKNYALGLGLGLIFPGGAQYYTEHYVRGGFLTALEGYLISEVFYAQPLRKKKFLNLSAQNFAAAAPWADSMSLHPASPQYDNWNYQFQQNVTDARSQLDVIEENNGLFRSEWAWLLGLHLYGLMDGFQAIYFNNNPHSQESRSVTEAVILSALIPGGGQIYNQSYGKAGLLYMSYIGSYISFNARQHTVVYYEQRTALADAEANSSLESDMHDRETFFRKKRNQYIWAPILFYLYSIADAAVDAMVSDFDSPKNLAFQPFDDQGRPALVLTYQF